MTNLRKVRVKRSFEGYQNEAGTPLVERYVNKIYGKKLTMISKQAMQIRFDKYFKSNNEDFNIFIIKPKQAFYNNHAKIFPYINYFMDYYDYDRELLMTYYHIKFMIDRKNNYSKELFIDELYEYILSDSMVKKIKKMVNDNYKLDLSAKKKNYKYKSIQFLDEHGLIILQASIAIKMMIPLVTHYIYQMGIVGTDPFLLDCFIRVFGYFEEDNNMRNKIYDFTLSKIKKTQNKDKRHWNNVEIYGKDMESETDVIYCRMITDIIYKCAFDGNVAAYLAKSINKNINWMLKEKFGKNNRAITGVKDSEGLSDLDKIEMNMSKVDESYIITGDINAKQVIKKLSKKYKIELNDDEVEFQIENLLLTKDQKDLIFQILASHFGSVREMHSVTKERIAKLSIIFKRMMSMKGYKIIQFMLTGIMHYNPNLKKLSKKELKAILDSDQYAFIEDKYRYAKNLILENNLFRDTLNKLLNSDFQLVDFNMGKTFKTINTEKYKVLIIYEFMKLIDDVI
jgi:hypothetical protein